MEQQPFMQTNYKQENNFRLTYNKSMTTKNLRIIYQLLIWVVILYTLVNRNIFPLLVIVYIFYLIIEFASYTCRFLLNKSSTNYVYNQLKEIFSTAPVLKLTCVCYHFEKTLEERKDKDGNIVRQEVINRVETYKSSDYFPYYSFRDISGLFKIDLNSDIFKNKSYIKLKLDTKIGFADTISCWDYEAFKSNFINQNRYRDEKMDFREDINIPNLSKVNLIKIKDEEPFYVNFFIFFLCVLLTMGVPYELLLDNISIEGTFQIHKIISTRYNLNDMQYNNMYGNSIPSIKLGRDEFNFAPNDYSNIDQSVEVNLPTLEEIEKAKMYENQIKYPIFDDEKINNDSNGDAAPVTELPTEEEIYRYKKKNE